MHPRTRSLLVAGALCAGIAGGSFELPLLGGQDAKPDYPFQPIPFTSVHLNDEFWAPRIEINRTTTIPVAFQQCERSQRVYHFERAAKALDRQAPRRIARTVPEEDDGPLQCSVARRPS